MKRILKGIGVSPGKITGRIKIIKPAMKFPTFHAGDILVTHITDPTMVRYMSRAGAIVCEIGGTTSHPAIVSREMGIPCVVAVKNAIKILKKGAQAEVNGSTGEIKY